MTDLTRTVRRRTNAVSTYRHKSRRIVVSLVKGLELDGTAAALRDMIVFRLQGCRGRFTISVRDAFLEAIRLDGSKVPRVLKAKKRVRQEKPFKKTQAAYAKQYGVPKGLVKGWWKQRAPLDNPDAMGDRVQAALSK